MKTRHQALEAAERYYFDDENRIIRERVNNAANLQAPRRGVDWFRVAELATIIVLNAMFWGALLATLTHKLGWW